MWSGVLVHLKGRAESFQSLIPFWAAETGTGPERAARR
jgi:hypothetical protein